MSDCIYCGSTKLSKSDVFPDYLIANKQNKIINPNVCEINHNNKFSDLFESIGLDVFKIILFHFDIRSKTNTKREIDPTIDINGQQYHIKYSRTNSMFDSITPSSDKTHKLGPLSAIQKIPNGVVESLKEGDIIKEFLSINVLDLTSTKMLRLISKICYEYVCLNLSLESYSKTNSYFNDIIDFICTGNPEKIPNCEIIDDANFYNIYRSCFEDASHFIGFSIENQKIICYINFFNYIAYKVVVCESFSENVFTDHFFTVLPLETKKYDTHNDMVCVKGSVVSNSVSTLGKTEILREWISKATSTKHSNFNKYDLLASNLNELVNNIYISERMVINFLKDFKKGIKKDDYEMILGSDERFMLYAISSLQTNHSKPTQASINVAIQELNNIHDDDQLREYAKTYSSFDKINSYIAEQW